jgi:hypothetical protein
VTETRAGYAERVESGDRRGGLGGVTAGDRWVAADGRILTVSWVRKIGVVCYRCADGQERVMDIVRFISSFTRIADPITDRPGSHSRAA